MNKRDGQVKPDEEFDLSAEEIARFQQLPSETAGLDDAALVEPVNQALRFFDERRAENLHAAFGGSRRRVTASGQPGGMRRLAPLFHHHRVLHSTAPQPSRRAGSWHDPLPYRC